jgi:hypothetical protein
MSQWSFKMLRELEFMIDDKGVLNQISCQIFAYVKGKEKLQSQITCWNILDIKYVWCLSQGLMLAHIISRRIQCIWRMNMIFVFPS